jgi:4-hydroxy-3-polyprenylbenzoate decarboxylase
MMAHPPVAEVVLAMTGASGACVGLTLLDRLLRQGVQVAWVVSDNALQVIEHETGLSLTQEGEWRVELRRWGMDESHLEKVHRYDVHDWFTPLASGSTAPATMIVSPCSMGSLAAIAHGLSGNLIHRCADVVLKERGQLLLMVRETPFSLIHLENMVKVTQAGGVVMPLCPAFYTQSDTVEGMINEWVDRALKLIGLPLAKKAPWYFRPE